MGSAGSCLRADLHMELREAGRDDGKKAAAVLRGVLAVPWQWAWGEARKASVGLGCW